MDENTTQPVRQQDTPQIPTAEEAPAAPSGGYSGRQEGTSALAEAEGTGGYRVCKRGLKTRDLWHFMRIMGRISKDARNQILNSDGEGANVDMMSLLLTEGADKAEVEINNWFADLTGRDPGYIRDEGIEFYMDVMEDLDEAGLDGFLTRAIRWYRKKGFGRKDSGSGSTESRPDTAGQTG